MTPAKIEQMYNALKRITMYESVKQLRRNSEDRYGLDANEALEYAYENVMAEARAGLRGVRLPKRPAPETAPATSTQAPAGQPTNQDKEME